jgi:type VI secretion system protein ImpM
MADVASTVGWYGKVPSTGDFISRRLARTTVNEIDRWCEVGMTTLRERAPETWQRTYTAAPVWNALLPARVVAPHACLVAVAASSDRVGRRFPLCVVASLPASALPRKASLGDYGEAMSAIVEQAVRASIGIDEFDARVMALSAQYLNEEDPTAGGESDIGAVLDELAIDAADLATVPLGAHASFPWPDLARTFDANGATSYWWATRAPGNSSGAGFTHRGTLTPNLFVTLFDERGAQAPPSDANR